MTPFEYAKLELGTTEVLGPESNDRIVEYLSTALRRYHKHIDDKIPWCSAFVNWCHVQAGIKGTNNAAARSWLDWGVEVEWPPAPGDVVVLWRNSKNGYKGHVGFYVGETKTHIKILGGNQGNKVCIASYPKTRLLGYRRAE